MGRSLAREVGHPQRSSTYPQSTAPPTKLSGLPGRAPPELEAIIERCLTKKPDERYQDLAELSRALAPFGGQPAQRSASVIHHVMGVTLTHGTPPHLADSSQQLPAAHPQ